MRTRHSLTVALIALAAIFIGVILSLLTGRGPTAHAEDQAPTAGATAAPTRAAPTSAAPGKPKINTKINTRATPARTTRKAAPSTSAAKPSASAAVTPPRLGDATLPEGATYDVSDDRLAFSMAHSTLEAGGSVAQLSRRLTTTIPVRGNTLVLSFLGYVVTEAHTTARLTVTVNGHVTTVNFRGGADREVLRQIEVPLRDVRSCRITIEVAVFPGAGEDGYLNVAAVEGEIS